MVAGAASITEYCRPAELSISREAVGGVLKRSLCCRVSSRRSATCVTTLLSAMRGGGTTANPAPGSSISSFRRGPNVLLSGLESSCRICKQHHVTGISQSCKKALSLNACRFRRTGHQRLTLPY